MDVWHIDTWMICQAAERQIYWQSHMCVLRSAFHALREWGDICYCWIKCPRVQWWILFHLMLLVISTNACMIHNQHGGIFEACAFISWCSMCRWCCWIVCWYLLRRRDWWFPHAHSPCWENFKESVKAEKPLVIKDYTTHMDCVIFNGRVVSSWIVSKRTWK